MTSSPVQRLALPLLLACTSGAALSQDQEAPEIDLSNAPHPVRLAPTGTIPQVGGTFPSQGITLLSCVPLSALGGASTGNDCWGYTSPSGREYAIFGDSDATSFVEITDPGSPVIVATLSGPNSLWRDMKIYQTYAYSVSEGGSGIQVFDLSQIDLGTVNLVNTIATPGTPETHNVGIDEVSGFLYRFGGGATSNNLGMRVYSLANPAAPVFVGQWHQAYIHDAQVVTYTSGPFAGRQICFASTDGAVPAGLDVIDVTDKANIFRVARALYGNPAFSHQVWVTEDFQYAYLNDELDENGVFPSTTHIFDISNINSPFEVTPAFDNGNLAITHNLYVKGDKVYQANYTSGLRVYDISNRTSPTEVAFFDTVPANDNVVFAGLWSVFPFFNRQNLVIGSDMQSGLFVWWEGQPQLDFSFNAGTPDFVDPNGQNFTVTVNELNPGDLQPGTAMLNYDAGAGMVSVPLTSQGGNTFTASFPSQPCGTGVQFYLSGVSVDNVTWSTPPGNGLSTFSALYGIDSTVVLADDFEAASGWVSGAPGDTATTGIWTRVNPIGTGSQPEDDNSPFGTLAWVTGQGSPGGSLGENDVDNGSTTLRSAVYDMTGMSNPVVSYFRWFHNSGNGQTDDVFVVDITNNGTTWVNVETVGPTGAGTSGGWIQHSFSVADFVAPTANVQLRFIATDNTPGSIVEAGIDDFAIEDLVCTSTNFYCTAKTTSQGCLPFMTANGVPSATATTGFRLFANNMVEGESALLLYAFKKANLDFHGGKLCVKAPFVRIASLIKASDGTSCTGCAQPTCRMFKRNFNQLIQGGTDPLLTAGQTVFTQYRQRDQFDPLGFGDNLSDGATFVIGP